MAGQDGESLCQPSWTRLCCALIGPNAMIDVQRMVGLVSSPRDSGTARFHSPGVQRLVSTMPVLVHHKQMAQRTTSSGRSGRPNRAFRPAPGRSGRGRPGQEQEQPRRRASRQARPAPSGGGVRCCSTAFLTWEAFSGDRPGFPMCFGLILRHPSGPSLVFRTWAS